MAEGRTPGVPRWLEVGAAWAWRLLLLAAVAGLVVYALSRLLFVLIPLLVALFFASVLFGPMERLVRRGVPRGTAAFLIVLGWFSLLLVAIGLIAAPIAAQAPDLASTTQQGLRRAAAAIAQGPFGLSADELVHGLNEAGRRVLQGGGAAGVVRGAGAAAAVLAGFVLTIVVLFFLLRDGGRMWSATLRATSASRRGQVERFGRRAWPTLRSYFLGVTTVALIDAVLIAVALMVVGVPLVLPLAVLTFLAAYFPVIGAVVAGVVAVLVTLVTGGLADAAIIGAAVIVIQQLEGNVLYPRIMRGRVSLHPLTTILAVAVGGTLAGVLGAFVAVPIAAVASATLGQDAGRSRRRREAHT